MLASETAINELIAASAEAKEHSAGKTLLKLNELKAGTHSSGNKNKEISESDLKTQIDQ